MASDLIYLCFFKLLSSINTCTHHPMTGCTPALIYHVPDLNGQKERHCARSQHKQTPPPPRPSTHPPPIVRFQRKITPAKLVHSVLNTLFNISIPPVQPALVLVHVCQPPLNSFCETPSTPPPPPPWPVWRRRPRYMCLQPSAGFTCRYRTLDP